MIPDKIKAELQNISFEIFRDFVKSVNEKHPNILINIKNENEIFEDVLATIKNAKLSLIKNFKTKEEIDKYQLGFMYGYLRSNLNTKWVNNYINKQSNDYKEFIVVKALKEFLKEDILYQIKVDSYYKNLLNHENNLLEINYEIDDFYIGLKELDQLNEKIENNYVLQALENLVNKYLNSYLNRNEEEFVWPMVKYFSRKGIIELISLDIE